MKYFLSFLFLAVIFLCSPIRVQAQDSVLQNEYFRGTIMNVVREGTDEFGDGYQDVRVRFESGESKGTETELRVLHNGQQQIPLVQESDRVILLKVPLPDGGFQFAVVDFYRLPQVLLFVGIFFLLVLLVVGIKRGIFSILGLLWTVVILMFFIVPQIAKGTNPFWVSLWGSCLIVLFSIFLAHGLNRRTVVASVGTFVTLLLSVLIGWLSIVLTASFGMGTESINILMTSPIGELLNFRGLLLAGILIGTLGVLDDVTTAQAATVEEIHLANKNLTLQELFSRGMSVGREHIIALVNTLVLAYAGASLPVLLLFAVYTQPLWVTLSSEMVVEEIVRAIAGSVSLLFAVPITTFLSAFVFGSKK